ncbi:basic leucine zipper 23-like isoform X2 [Silene latifolia]|uniref:basic leucine zipper 23-like isoform X2 n=1 Tax=Silene latifolia TaxID=37657 RepID=UPI003D777405
MEDHNLTNANNIDTNGSSKMSVLNFDDIDFQNHELHSNTNLGPEFPHSHTCVHMHTKIVGTPSSNADSYDHADYSSESRDRGGNREAVRKYRQKKKAYTASLANELASLKAANQQLIQKLQSRSSLEAEVARLKCLLVDIRGRIEGEIGSFPYQKPVKPPNMYPNIPNTNFPGSSNIACNENGKCGQDCEFQNLNCMAGLGSPPSFT